MTDTLETETEFNLFEALETNKTLETAGVWVSPYGPIDKGYPAFHVARMGGANSKYEKVFTGLCKPYARQIQANARNPDDKIIRMVKDFTETAFIATCLFGWKNVKKRDKSEWPFSKEAAKDLFKQLPQLFEDLYEKANTISTFQKEDLEDEAGN